MLLLLKDTLSIEDDNLFRHAVLLRKIHLPFPDHSYLLVPSNSLANVEKRL